MSDWKEYRIADLFAIEQSDGDNQAQRLDEGDIPLVSSGSYNNGVCKYIDKGDGISQLFPGNVLTVDMFGKAFYQESPFYAVSHARVCVLRPIDAVRFNKFIALFLVAVIDKTFRPRYSYEEMCSSSALEKEAILLPSKDDRPDWDYMEGYIKSIYPYLEKLVK